MVDIYKYCEQWENCSNPQIKKIKENKILKGEDTDNLTPDEIGEINEICRNCKEPLYIEEMKCPICGTTNLGSPKFIKGGKVNSQEIFNYYCNQCNRILYSTIDFFE